MISSKEGAPVGEEKILSLLVNSVTGYAIYALDPQGCVQTWNHGAELLKGYTKDEVLGKHFSMFYPESERESQKPNRALAIAAETGRYVEEGWRTRKDGSKFWAQDTITPIVGDNHSILGYAKVTRDGSAERTFQDRERLIHEIAVFAATVDSFEDLLQMVVKSICTFLEWQVGHAYVWNSSTGRLESAEAWHFERDPARYAEFVSDSRNVAFSPGQGLPGVTLQSKKAVFIRDVFGEIKILRAKSIADVGLKTAVGIPLTENGNVFAVLEFFSESEAIDDARVIDLAEFVSVQVSRFMERQRMSEEHEVFFRASHDLLCLAGFDGYFKRLNPVWTKVLGYTEEEMLQHPWLYFVHPDDVEKTVNAANQLQQDSAVISVDNRYRCKGGSYRWLQWHAVANPDRQMIYAIGRDVTEERAVEEKLNETLALQTAAFESSAYAIVCVNLEGKVTVFNKGAETMLGYKAEEFIGTEGPPLLTDPESLEQRMEDLSKIIGKPMKADANAFIELAKTGVEHEFEWTYVRKDGTRFPALLTVTALKDSNGNMTGYMGMLRDITQRRKAEAEKERLLALIERSPDLIGYANEVGQVVYQNEGGNRLLGFGVNADQNEALDPASPNWANQVDWHEVLPSIQLHGFWQGETTLRHRDGHEIPVSQVIFPISDDLTQQPYLATVIRDITSTKQAEAAQRRLLAIIEESPDLIAFSTQDDILLYQNKGGNRMLGYPDSFNPAGKTVSSLHPEWVMKLGREEIWPALISYGYWSGETAFVRSDGTTVPTSQAIFFLPSEADEPPYVATIARDISGLKRTEAQLEQQAVDLRMSNQELEQFAYVASHDLQEPLRMVCSFLGLLELEFDETLSDDAREYIRYAVDGGMRMRALIDGLLEFSRVGQQKIDMAPVNMEDVFAEVAFNLRMAVEESGATITNDPLPTVLGDRMSLSRLLQNLISNSLKFRTEEPVKIHIGAQNNGDVAQLWVQDNGIGIDPRHEEKIFMIFQRLHPKSKYPGSGIGLSICRKIVERHGGRLWLDRETRNGAKFVFTLKQPGNHP